jgi:hypothetical protein
VRGLSCVHLLRFSRWKLHQEPEWLANAIIQTVASLPSLSEFTIDYSFYYIDEIPTLHLRKNLTKLTVHGSGDRFAKIVPGIAQTLARSPDIKHLEVHNHYSWLTRTALHDFFSDIPANTSLPLQHIGLSGIRMYPNASITRHLRGLTSLFVDEKYAHSTKGIWQALQTEGIQLAHLRTVDLNDALLQFLSSYQGLRDLRLDFVSGKDDDDSDRLAEIFFKDVLPQHADSLEILHIGAAYEGKWVSFSVPPSARHDTHLFPVLWET